MRKAVNLLSVVIAIGWLGLASAFAADGWRYHVSRNDGHELTYSEAGKVTFYLGCGRFFALQLRYPGAAKAEGKARVTIANAKTKMVFDGEFVPAVEVEVPEPMSLATTFAQTYLGFAKNDPRVYGRKWLALRARFYALLGAGEPLTVSAGKDSYQLPPIDAADWRKPFESCGLGASW